MKILLLDDDLTSCDYLAEFLGRFEENGANGIKSGISITKSHNGVEALEKIKKERFDLLIADVGLPDISGIEVAKIAMKTDPSSKVVLISGREDIIQTVNSIGWGIFDFLTKPIDMEKMAKIVTGILEKTPAFSGNAESIHEWICKNKSGRIDLKNPELSEILLNPDRIMINAGVFSEKLSQLYRKVAKLQDYPHIPLLIRGETGTGKEELAKFFHYHNLKNSGPFIGLNCSHLNRQMFESELFGYEKGSFTGGSKLGGDGKILAAAKGTLFLDEVTEIPMELQPKLLRVIEEREYYRICGNKKEPVECRLVFATNKNIPELVKKGSFREDLYFRLNTCEIIIPPLRERSEAIIPLTLFLILRICREFGVDIPCIEMEALKFIESYSWPGNVRELKNTVTKIILLQHSPVLTKNHFLEILTPGGENLSKINKPSSEGFILPDVPFSLENLEYQIIRQTLVRFHDNKSKTAEFLGLKRAQLYNRFKEVLRK